MASPGRGEERREECVERREGEMKVNGMGGRLWSVTPSLTFFFSVDSAGTMLRGNWD